MFLACKSNKKASHKKESGEVMLEAMIVVVITVFVLIWLLGVGFIYYQRYVTTITTNDVAVKIASTYNNPSSDIIMGYVTTEELSNRDLYRNFTFTSSASDLHEVNEDRAEAYVKYMLDKANFAGTVEAVSVKLELVNDSFMRKHVQITTNVTFRTPFGEGLEMMGMSGTREYVAVACADCTDMADYVSTVSFAKALGGGTYVKGTGFVDSLIKMLNSFVGVYNNKHS